MKAAIFERPGIENLKINDDVEQPKITDHDVLIRVKMAGVNPFDHITISGTREIKPGAETSGEIEKIREHVSRLKKGDRVIVYNRVFDGTCDMCLNQSEMLCRNGGKEALTHITILLQQLNTNKEHSSQESYDNEHPLQDLFESKTHCIS